MPFERGGSKRAKEFLAMESVNSLRISAPRLREGRDGKCEGRNEKCEYLPRESVSSSPIVRVFGKGKCEFIANFSATMVTSLPSVSVSLSLSHRKYLTHNIGSASALPIILARESVSLSPIVRIFGKGKCEFIANFSATMVTSLPSVSVSLSLSVSPKVPHAQYRKRFRASYNKHH